MIDFTKQKEFGLIFVTTYRYVVFSWNWVAITEEGQYL